MKINRNELKDLLEAVGVDFELDSATPGFTNDKIHVSFSEQFLPSAYLQLSSHPELECKNDDYYNFKMAINGYTKLIEKRQKISDINPFKDSIDCYSSPQRTKQPIKVYTAQKEAA